MLILYPAFWLHLKCLVGVLNTRLFILGKGSLGYWKAMYNFKTFDKFYHITKEIIWISLKKNEQDNTDIDLFLDLIFHKYSHIRLIWKFSLPCFPTLCLGNRLSLDAANTELNPYPLMCDSRKTSLRELNSGNNYRQSTLTA